MGYWENRGLRGSALEEMINHTNRFFREKGLAVVQKIPTSITPVELDPKKGTIKLAYFEAKSTVDYLGNIQGVPICFDAKETGQKSLPIANIHEHQIEFMTDFHKQGGLSFLIVWFKHFNEYYLLPLETLQYFWEGAKNGGRKSIPYRAFDKRLIITAGDNYILNYLDTLNAYLDLQGEKNEKNNEF